MQNQMDKEIIQQNELYYEINKENSTAVVVNSPNVAGDVFIPTIIEHELKQFRIICLKESFKNNKKIKRIIIPDDSCLQFISKKAFSKSSIKTLIIPSTIDKLEDGWCSNTPKLKTVIISPSNKHFKYLDEEHQIIVGKSDPNEEIFDTIIFANRNIERVTIPNFIKYIKPYAFENCDELKTIEISEDSKLVSIGKKAFHFSTLTKLFIPSNVKELGDEWLNGASELKTVTISPSNKHFKYLDEEHQIIVGKSDPSEEIFDTIIFVNRNIKQFTIPNFIKYIKPCAFEYCDKLSKFEVSNDSKLVSLSKEIFSLSSVKNFFIPASVEMIEDNWCSYASELKTVTISPSNKHFKYLDEEHQIIIGKSDSNEEIFDTIIFANRNIKQATIPNFIKYIKPCAFENCSKLKTVEISKNSELLEIGKQSFSSSSLESITIPKTVIKIHNNAFSFCSKLKSFSLEKGSKLESFQNDLFFFCSNLHTVKIPEDSSLQKICYNALYSLSIKEFFIPASVKELEDGWLGSASKLKTVIISPSNKHFKYLDEEHQIIIGKSDPNEEIFDTIIFVNRNIKQFTIPNFIKYIKPYAFENCSQLETVNFQNDSKISYISKKTFHEASIKNLFIPASVKELDDEWLGNISKIKTVIISPSNKHFKYLDEEYQIIIGKSDPNEEIFDTIIFANRNIKRVTIPNFIKYIKPCAFEYCDELKTIEISEDSKLVSIGEKAFYDTSIDNITIPKSVTSIKNSAFSFCKNLQSFSFEEGSKLFSLKKIFNFTDNLKKIDIPENSSLKMICSDVLYFTSIENFFIPASVEMIEDNWCDYASKLKTVTISPSNKHFKYLDEEHQIIVGKSDPDEEIFDTIIFANRNIKRATIPNFIKYIKSCAFENCMSLKKIEIQDDSEIESIDYKAFSSTALTNFKVPKNVQTYNEFLSDNKEIRCFEFLGDYFIDNENTSIFKDLKNSILASFPNVKELNIQLNKFPDLSKEFMLLVSPNVKITLLKDSDDDNENSDVDIY